MEYYFVDLKQKHPETKIVCDGNMIYILDPDTIKEAY